MKNVSKDGDFVIVKVPKADLDSLIRFVAHAVEQNPDKVLDLCQQIVRGDLMKQDNVVAELTKVLDLVDWSLVLNKQEALDLCDDLADIIYDQMPIHMATQPAKPERHLRVVTVCSKCHRAFVKGSVHDCESL